MKKDFSQSWNASIKPNKQRKFRFNAPLHVKANFLNAHLSKELRQKYGMRAVRVRVGDRVRIMRGQFKRQEGKVEEADIRTSKIFIAKVEHTKRDGTKARYPIEPSNVLIVELNTDDKKRFNKQKSAKPVKAAPKPEGKPGQAKSAPVSASAPSSSPATKAEEKKAARPKSSNTKTKGQ